jgi:mono/diheme cytochrome c family protein/DNA-binding beta-propeller fold protein YncE
LRGELDPAHAGFNVQPKDCSRGGSGRSMHTSTIAVLLAFTACARPSASPPAKTTGAAKQIPIVAVSREGSPVAIAKIGGKRVVLVADPDEDAIHTVDMESRTVLARTPLPGRPTQVLVLADGKLAVARRDAATVSILAAVDAKEPLVQVATIATADEPIALAATASNLFVVSGWGRSLERFWIYSGVRTAKYPLGREPRSVALSRDGNRAYVGFMAEGGVATIDLSTNTIITSLMETEKESTSSFIPTAKSIQSFKFKPSISGEFVTHEVDRVPRQTFALATLTVEGKDMVFAPHERVHSGKPEVKSDGYGSSEVPAIAFDVGVLEASGSSTKHPAPPHFSQCRLPRAAVADSVEGTVIVACLGNNTVVAYDATTDHPVARTRFARLVSGGPYGLAIDEEHREVVVATMFDRSVQVLPLHYDDDKNWSVAKAPIALPHVAGLGLSAEAAEGRQLFHVAGSPISSDGRACASCHPDARDDGLVWSTPKGPRQTLFLAGRLGRGAPYGWSGVHETLAAHVEATLGNLKGQDLPDRTMKKLTAWLDSIPPPPRSKHELTTEEARGRAIFMSAETACTTCHEESKGFGGGPSDVKSATPGDSHKEFIVPSLHFLAGSAPYFHDGRYKSIDELIEGVDGTMGNTKQLSPSDKRALASYLMTL